MSAALVSLIVGTVLVGCAAPTGSPPTPEPRAPARTWEEEWEHTLAAARQEGEVVVYSDPNAEVRRAYTEAFQNKYGIRVTYIGMRGNEASARIQAEREAGIYAADMYIGGATTPLAFFKPPGYLDPIEPLLILPEVKDPSNWVGGHLHFTAPDDDLVFLFNIDAHQPFTINTDLVRPGELTSWQDLLRPAFKGRIGLPDPRVAGPGLGNWALWSKVMGEPFQRALLAQEPFVTTDRRSLADRVARGALAVGIATDTTYAKELGERGLPIKVERTIPKEGTFVSPSGGSITVFKRAPHPNATRVYLNWFLTREAMEVHCAVNLQPCLRTDIKRDPDLGVSLADLIAQGIPYIETHTPEGEQRLARAAEHARQMLR